MYRIERNGYAVIFADDRVAEFFGTVTSAVALGNFDGVHIAHRELLSRAVKLKKENTTSLVGAWTFSKNPLEYFVKNAPKAICSPEKKAEIMLSCGLDFVVLADFGIYKDMSHEDFCEYLKSDIGAECVVCGYNFRFGQGGRGNPEYLMSVFGKDKTEVVSEVDYGGVPVSSTRIRALIENGDIQLANTLLGRSFSLVGDVVHGKQLGRNIGCPTANQCFDNGNIIPKNGIYATRCIIDGNVYIGVTNVGVRPTVEDSKNVNAETYILDFDGDIYGKKIEIEFIEYLRAEIKFSSLDELKNAILNDAEKARRIVKL